MSRKVSSYLNIVSLSLALPLISGCLMDGSKKVEKQELSAPAQALLDEADQELFLGRYTSAMKKVDEVLAMHPDSREALNRVFQIRLAQLENEAMIANKMRAESQSKASRDALKLGILPEDKPTLDRAAIELRSGMTVEEESKIKEKLDKKIALLDLDGADLDQVLYKIFKEADINIALDPGNFAGKKFTIRGKEMTVRYLLENISRTQGLSFTVDNENVWIVSSEHPIFITRTYRLKTGVTRAKTQGGYEGLGTLGVLGQTTQSGSGAGGMSAGAGGGGSGFGGGGSSFGGSGSVNDAMKSHLELLIDKLPVLIPQWPKESEIFLDKKENLVIMKSTREAIAEVEKLLKLIDEVPKQVSIEARFVQIVGEENFDFGVSWDFKDPGGNTQSFFFKKGNTVGYPNDDVAFPDGQPVNPDVFVNEPNSMVGTKTDFPRGFTEDALGQSTFSLNGVFRDRPFTAMLTAIERTSFSNMVSAPSVTVSNNCTATIGITKNLPFIESYEVQNIGTSATGGIGSIIQTTPVVTATINDENFEGRALIVTPSIGADGRTIVMYIQPVVRTKVDDLEIQGSVIVAAANNIEVPALVRPILETKFITTQVTVSDGDTVVIGGLITDEEQHEEQKVPILGDIPLLGALFKRTGTRHDKANLYIFITVKLISPSGALYVDKSGEKK